MTAAFRRCGTVPRMVNAFPENSPQPDPTVVDALVAEFLPKARRAWARRQLLTAALCAVLVLTAALVEALLGYRLWPTAFTGLLLPAGLATHAVIVARRARHGTQPAI